MSKKEPDARRSIDANLELAGWIVQDNDEIDLTEGLGVAVREYPTDTGPVDYLLFVDCMPVGIIEAKKDSLGHNLIEVELQTHRYQNSQFKHFDSFTPRFVYQATGKRIRFTDYNDIEARARDIYNFQRPEYLKYLLGRVGWTFRNALKMDIPQLEKGTLRDCQYDAIVNLQKSMANGHTRGLIQMATGAGKTYTAITAIYRLLKYAKARRILFLVDTRNLGKQALDEFIAYKTEDSRTFTEIYEVSHLKQSVIPQNSSVYICTIQRLFSILVEEPLDEGDEEGPVTRLLEKRMRKIEYNKSVPPEFFDMIVVDECHRSIYNVWAQIFDYFDAFITGLTATPDSRTLGFFSNWVNDQRLPNLVSEYTREQAIIDNVNVGSDTYIIKTVIQKNGATIHRADVEKRDRLTKAKRWEQLDEDMDYAGTDLDRSVVNPSTIRSVIQAFKQAVETEIYPDREGQLPKTLIFAKDDPHADDIVDIVREVFGKGNEFCKKITYRADHAEENLNQFRNSFYPRVVVTVNMIATGTDVKPLEILLFMRDVRSKNYFEQMVGRGTRTIDFEDLKKVSPTAKSAKTHFVIFDTCDVTSSIKLETRDLDVDRGASLKDLLEGVGVGGIKDKDVLTTLAGRLIRVNHTLKPEQATEIRELVNQPLSEVVGGILDSFDEDKILARLEAKGIEDCSPGSPEYKMEQEMAIEDGIRPIRSAKFRKYILSVKKLNEQIIDLENQDKIISSGWDIEGKNNATRVLDSFKLFIKEHLPELEALGIFYGLPYENRSRLLKEVKGLISIMENEYHLTIDQVHDAYAIKNPDNKLGNKSAAVDLITMVRYELKLSKELGTFKSKVNQNFKDWTFAYNRNNPTLTENQMTWLHEIRDHIATSLSMEVEDLEYAPFDQMGGLGAIKKLFTNPVDVINDLNNSLIRC